MIIHNPIISGSIQFPADADGNKVTLQVNSGVLETIQVDSSGNPTNVKPESNLSGSFSGSFTGDGSNLTGIAASSFNIDLLSAETIVGDDNILFSDTSDSGTEKKGTFVGGLNSLNVFSGSSQLSLGSASGTIDISTQTNFAVGDTAQIDLILTNDTLSAHIKGGVISGSAQLLNVATDFGTGRVSGDDFGNVVGDSTFTGSFIGDGTSLSGVTSYTDSDNTDHLNSLSVISGSSQVNADSITNFDSNVKTKLDADSVVSGSSQIDVTATTNYSSINQYTDSDVKTKLDAETVISGSSQVSISSSQISDVAAFSQSGTYASLRAQSTTKGDVGLGNVDNTTDAGKPVSTAGQTALNLKANLASPTFTGNPTAPTQADNDNSTKIATTAYVQREVSDLLGGAPAAFDTLLEISASIANGDSDVVALTTVVGGKLQKDQNLSDLTNPGTARTNLGVDAAGTDNSTDVTLTGSLDYLTISGQAITLGSITNDDLAGSIANTKLVHDGITIAGADTSLGGTITASTIGLAIGTLVSGSDQIASTFAQTILDDTSAGAVRTTIGVDAAGTDNSTDVTLAGNDYLTISGQAITAGAINNDDLTNSSITIDGSAISLGGSVTTTNTQLSTEAVQDIVGAMFSGNTETRISVTYQDGDGTIDLVADDMTANDNTQNTTTLSFVDSTNDIILRNTTSGASSGTDDIKFVAGSNITLTHTDADNITISSTDTNTVYSHPTFDGDDISIDTTPLTGATVISDLDFNITTDTNGHVTDANGTVSTRTLSASDLSLGNVTNESKSTMFTSPTFTGVPISTTPADNDNSTKIATTAFVMREVSDLLGGAPAALDTLLEISASISNGDSDVVALTTTVGTKLAKSSNLSDLADPGTARTNLGVDAAGTDNSTDVTLGNTNYLSLSGQAITGGTVPIGSGGTGATSAGAARTALGVDAAGTDNSTDVTLVTTSHDYLSVSGQAITLGTIQNNDLASSSITINGSAISLGGTVTTPNDNTQLSTADVRGKISATGNAQYDSSTGVITSTDTNTQLSNEAVQDIVGGMLSGTETGITVTYQDTTGDIDFVVASQTENDFTTVLKNKLDNIEASADVNLTAAETRTLVGTGNAGVIPTIGTAGHFLKHDGTFGLPSYTTNTDTNTQLSQEQVEDFVGGMLTGTQTGITVTYQDTTGDIDFVVATQSDVNFTSALNTKLSGIETSATADQSAAEIRTLVGTGNSNFVPSIGTAGHFLKHDGTFGLPSYTTNTNTTYSVGDGGLTEINFTSADNTKLDGIAVSANNYSHPTNYAGDDIDIDTTPLTGAVVISDLDINITTDTNGHVSDANASVATRTLTKADLGLGNATNESKATMFTSPTFTGTPVAPTPAANTNTTQIATTAYVQTELTDLIGGAPGTLDTLNELAAAINDDASYASTLTTALGTKAPLASPTFTGTIAIPNIANLETAVAANTAKTSNIVQTTVSGNAGSVTNGVYTTGTQTIGGAKSFSSAVNIDSTVASTTITTGALIVDGGVGIAGALNVGGDVVAYASSDERLKDNIELISNPIEKVQSLKGVTWDWNSNADELQKTLPNVGVIAQDVEKVLPQLVIDRDNGFKGVDYAKLTGLLIEAIKDQQKQIDELKSKLS